MMSFWFGLDIFNDITISSNPTISEEAAILSASSDIANPITKSMVEEDLKILPIPTNQEFIQLSLGLCCKYRNKN